jgi:hypothetical protein
MIDAHVYMNRRIAERQNILAKGLEKLEDEARKKEKHWVLTRRLGGDLQDAFHPLAHDPVKTKAPCPLNAFLA